MGRHLWSGTLTYPGHRLDPVDLLHFIEAKPFTRAWRDLRLSEESLAYLQAMLMVDPSIGSVIRGTGGLRKMRFSPPEWPGGKRGGLRVCYVHYIDHHIILLVTIYSKSEMDDLTEVQKKQIRSLIERQEAALARGRYT